MRVLGLGYEFTFLQAKEN